MREYGIDKNDTDTPLICGRRAYGGSPSAQHRLAADAAGAARKLAVFYQCGRVPSLVSLHTLASGAAEARRWAARNPKSSYRIAE